MKVNLKRAAKVLEDIIKMSIDLEKDRRCKFCNSRNIVRNGKRRGTQYWLCKNCGRGFVDNQALPKMKYPAEAIGSAIYQYYTGSSLDEIRGHIDQHYNTRPSGSTIYSWLTRFSKAAIDEAKKHTPKVGDTWVADETVIRIGGKKYWLWDIIDEDTRFLLATHLSSARTTKDAQKLMEKASERADKTPKIVITDKLAAYLDGVELAFGADTKHIPSKPFIDKDSTNVIERFHGTLKDRTKVMRGFKQTNTARLILDGWLVYYNFFRPHEYLKDKTPAQVAGIKFPYENWLDVVKKQSPLEKLEQARDHELVNTPIEYYMSEDYRPRELPPEKPYRKRTKAKRKRKSRTGRKRHTTEGISIVR